LFLFGEQHIAYSAHQARTTAKTFRRLKQAIEGSRDLGGKVARVSNKSGAEQIELTSGQLVECVARSTSSGRGFTGDAIVIDEAQDLDSEQLAAILPMVSTRPNPQIWYGLSMGNESSTHLGSLRAQALAGQDPRVCWLEWSLPEGARVDDPAVWAACNPAHPARISMEAMRAEFRALGAEQFARERLGKSNWPADDTGKFAVISRAEWQAGEDSDGIARGPVSFGVAVSRDGRSAAIVVCGPGKDDLPLLEVADWRPGDGRAWVGPRLADLTGRHKTAGVAWDDGSLAGQLGLGTYVKGSRVVTPKAGELAAACGKFQLAFERRAARHDGNVQLTAAVGAARVRPSGPAWFWDDKGYGAELLQAATWALHASQRRTYDVLKSIAPPT